VERERVYFTWPDRRLRYECRGCGACCKGHQIGVDAVAGELVQLVAKRPEIAAFVRMRGDSTVVFNPRDRCWFLEDDGLCRVEREDGRAAKPAACRLFPFNRVFRAGTILVVDYNSVLCPLAVVGDGGVTHDEVLAELDTIRDPGLCATVEPDDALFAAERGIAGALYATPTPDAALALTPSLRFNELYGPRQYAVRAKMSPLLARMWLAWLGFATLGERLAQRALGMQELTTLYGEQGAVMGAIARWDDVPALKPGTLKVAPDPLARALAERCIANRKPARSLGELVREVLADSGPVARITALKGAEPMLRAAFH